MTTAFQSALTADKEGCPFRDHLIESARDTLLLYKRFAPDIKVTISTAGRRHACSACKTQSGKVFSIDEALRLMPLPCSTCSFSLFSTHPGYCRCIWLPVVEEQ